MVYKIIVDKQSRINSSSEKKQYEVDIEELRCKDNVYDSLVITKDEAYVMRRLSLSELHVLSVLDQEVKEPLGNLNIELFEGDNYIYLLDMEGNKFYAEYLIKNDFNDIYVTTNKMNSAINQSVQSIELNVNQKLTSYSTTEEMYASINMKANEIINTVQNTYATKEQLNTAKSEIKQTTDGISTTVSKKVGNNEVISKINQTSEAVKIDANKIQLSANDILNLLAGNTINITSKNIILKGDKLNIDKNGKIICSDVEITGGKIKLNKGSRANPSFEIGNNFFCSEDYISIGEGTLGSEYIEISTGSEAFISVTNSNIDQTRILGSGIETPKLVQGSLKSIKKNIKKLKVNALELIKNSDICLYNLKGEKAKTKKHIGLVIGEGYNCPNEVISEDMQGVEQYSMTSLAWKAIQELIQENGKLKQRIEKLEVQNGKN